MEQEDINELIANNPSPEAAIQAELRDSADVDLLAKYKTLKELLKVAICPNTMNGCKDGVLINPYGEPEQCQWCDMTKQALKGKR